MEKWMKNGTFGEKWWKNGRKNGRKTALFFTKIQSPVSGVEKWGKIEVSGGLRKIGDFIGLVAEAVKLHKQVVPPPRWEPPPPQHPNRVKNI